MATENDDPLRDLIMVRDEIRRTENEILPELRARRDELICLAREHGAIGDEISAAAGLSRQSVHTVLREHGVPAPNRTHSAARTRRRIRLDLGRALDAAGIDTRNPDELGQAVVQLLTDNVNNNTERTPEPNGV